LVSVLLMREVLNPEIFEAAGGLAITCGQAGRARRADAMRGRETALPESLRELWAKWINAGRIAVLRVDHTTDFSVAARPSTG
jgi:hypothetical protein